MGMRSLILIIHNVRSANNVGSLFRTAEGLGVDEVILSGYTPYPKAAGDERLPHIADKVERRLQKTSLGAHQSIKWHRTDVIVDDIRKLRSKGYIVAGLEQAPSSIKLSEYRPEDKVALVVGNELSGLDDELLGETDVNLEIPMFGKKESYNVAAAGAMALFHLRFS
jgi:23S rRNA (guanosine2251-2'-O)-methyltransferase